MQNREEYANIWVSLSESKRDELIKDSLQGLKNKSF
jgi:hypothetical protein